ncbi:ATP-binding protein [Pyrobaculum sp.]|uniref:ATP-binding protein n=1 Tax=Pyrobaculum sp. TaxID=2004705 RepID=UPI003D0B95AF
MKICDYVIWRGEPPALGEAVDGCVVWLWTKVLRPSAEVVGPCSPSRTDACAPPREGERIVWFWHSGKYLVYRRDIWREVYAAVWGALETGRPATVLLAGASRTGKTSMARMVLEALGMPYQILSGDQFLSKYVGESEAAVREALSAAAQRGISLIVDEIDGLFPSVDRFGAEQPAEVVKTRTAFLHYMDRLMRSSARVALIATTNVDVNLFPEEVRNRFKTIVEFPKPSAEEYELVVRLYGGDPSLAQRAVAAMAPYDAVERCATGGPCRLEPEMLAVYAGGAQLAHHSSSAAIPIADLRRYISLGVPFTFTLSNYGGENTEIAEALYISLVSRKAVVITRDREEYGRILKQARYYDVVLAPLEDTVDARDIWAAYRRVPVALIGWRDAPRGVRRVTASVDQYYVGAKPLRQWLEEEAKRVSEALAPRSYSLLSSERVESTVARPIRTVSSSKPKSSA